MATEGEKDLTSIYPSRMRLFFFLAAEELVAALTPRFHPTPNGMFSTIFRIGTGTSYEAVSKIRGLRSPPLPNPNMLIAVPLTSLLVECPLARLRSIAICP